MDLPEAPAIIVERPAPCADVAKAEELLHRTLAPALAPRGSWSFIARFSRKGASLTVEGQITDEVDTPVAHRVLTQPGNECASLARAIGVWAALVLDAEAERAARAPPPSRPEAPVPAPIESAPEEKQGPEASLSLTHDEGERTLELGLSMFLMGGTGSGVVAGPTVFGVVEASQGWFLRPALFIGQTLDGVGAANNVSAWLAEARFDVCGRIAGFYIERHGIQLDVCAGLEAGFTHVDVSATSNQPQVSDNLPLVAVGPSLGLRGELGNGLALTIRAVMDLNLVRSGIRLQAPGMSEATSEEDMEVSPSIFVGRGELGLSWQLR